MADLAIGAHFKKLYAAMFLFARPIRDAGSKQFAYKDLLAESQHILTS